MSGSLPRLASMISATCALAFFLWYSSSWMHGALVLYIVTVNFALMGWAWFVFDIYKPVLASRWFDSAEIEKEGQIYHWVGLPWFRSFQQFIGWNKLLGVPPLRVNVESLAKGGTRIPLAKFKVPAGRTVFEAQEVAVRLPVGMRAL